MHAPVLAGGGWQIFPTHVGDRRLGLWLFSILDQRSDQTQELLMLGTMRTAAEKSLDGDIRRFASRCEVRLVPYENLP